MQFSKFIVAAAAFAVAQAVEFTNPSFNSVTAGQPFNISWSGAVGAVTLTLKDGPANALVTVNQIASGLTGTSYSWNVPSTLAANTYALQIDDSTGVPNYSTQFQLIGGASSSSAATSSTSSGSSSTGSSSSLPSVTSTSSVSSNSTTTTGSSSKTSSASKTSSGSSTATGSKTTSATGSTSSTSAPSSASGLSSPLAFVFLALAAILTLN